MQECIICNKNIDLNLSSFTEHFRQHDKRQEDIRHGRIRCGFCGSEFLNVKKLLQHLIAFHQVSQPKMNVTSSASTSMIGSQRNGSSNNQTMIEKSNKVLLLMDKDKKIDGLLKSAKEKIVEHLQGIIEVSDLLA
uniref:C2H2-type domain-containing protein n=1 Tax=Panagrolaimus superbus TaxID=310955 RepID=A0A914YSZ6_9BILA